MCCWQVFRRNDAELNQFTLVGQTVFEAREGELGELLVDISSQPLSVKAGDLIGFHVLDRAVIPYDEDEARMSTLYSLSLDSVNSSQGHEIVMDSSLELARTYSLLANILVRREFTTRSLSHPSPSVRIIINIIIITGAADFAAFRKEVKYSDLLSSHTFQPLAFETLGPLSSSTTVFLTELGRQLLSSTGEPRETAFPSSVCLSLFKGSTLF